MRERRELEAARKLKNAAIEAEEAELERQYYAVGPSKLLPEQACKRHSNEALIAFIAYRHLQD